MNTTDQSYIDGWNETRAPAAAVIIESDQGGAPTSAADVASATGQAAAALTQAAEKAGNEAAGQSADEYSASWARH